MVEMPGFEPNFPFEAKLLADADLIERLGIGTGEYERGPATKGS
jgi:hypothetical protein